jgi:monoterpene epsilon-lactone hydrolase
MQMVKRLQSSGGGARVLSVDYGLAPEHPYPTALNQIKTAYDWLVNDQHISPARIVIAGTPVLFSRSITALHPDYWINEWNEIGDSAGGALALLLACSLRDRQQPPPSGVALISPWVDFKIDDAYKRNANTDILPNRISLLAPNYMPPLPADSKLNYDDASPLHAKLHALPPLYVMRGTLEIFDDAIKAFVNRARDEGATVTEVVGEGMVGYHVSLSSLTDGICDSIVSYLPIICRFGL